MNDDENKLPKQLSFTFELLTELAIRICELYGIGHLKTPERANSLDERPNSVVGIGQRPVPWDFANHVVAG